jgi:type II secretory pathway pseudopilin PulG
VAIVLTLTVLGILAPTFFEAKEKARQENLKKQAKQIYSAIILYTEANDGYLPFDMAVPERFARKLEPFLPADKLAVKPLPVGNVTVSGRKLSEQEFTPETILFTLHPNEFNPTWKIRCHLNGTITVRKIIPVD